MNIQTTGPNQHDTETINANIQMKPRCFRASFVYRRQDKPVPSFQKLIRWNERWNIHQIQASWDFEHKILELSRSLCLTMLTISAMEMLQYPDTCHLNVSVILPREYCQWEGVIQMNTRWRGCISHINTSPSINMPSTLCHYPPKDW